ncbi:type II toxin-antitoxin system RatA family toxin [Wenzhouxiangella sp. AB-CW3]|uniref:type II toxin-antitoxin system RatA family toxin n=1 Tax=Wenzhouxiangella sp. AB-CW3 TaxID=2771012 RepID=UPI00168A6B17|nr:type II toxin-antitoxin system RatA family toxin [Wenzhouxiangella sp. AB-CW3]QOC23709.1 type II toxin-antitoxin system RatA family toxin [Wenzhouxiangella sp. AB-CW3]
MPEVHRFALVPYRPDQIFDLVRDVARYPEFLNWVRTAQVHEECESLQLATLEVSLGGLVRRFTTSNVLDRPHSLAMQLQDGPFDELSGRWSFEPLEGGCRVSLDLRFRMPGSLLLRPFRRNFARMADRMVDDFARRAEAIHG